MTEVSKRQQVITEARSWMGTPWGHLQKTKGPTGQIDCVQFLHSCATAAGVQCGGLPVSYNRLSDGTEIISYLNEWFKLKKFTVPKYVTNYDVIPELKDGDILVFKYWGKPHHVGIATTFHGYRGMIHASSEYKKVTEHILDKAFTRILVAVYDLGVD